MPRELLVKRLCSILALILLGPGAFATPAAGARQDSGGSGRHQGPEAAGDLDPAFGNGGIQTTDFFGYEDGANGVAIQTDGKVVLVGYAQHGIDSSTSDFAITRYNQDGSLDQQFGSGGKQATDFFGHYDQANALAIQSDGKIVVVGFTNHSADSATLDFALARYNPDGSLDQSFGSGGKQTTDFFGNWDSAYKVAIQSDGKILVAGLALHSGDFSSADFALARYNPNGTLDQGFGAGGKQTTDFLGNADAAQGIIVQPDGKIVAAGYARSGNDSNTDNFALARYNPDGSLDQSFGAGGKQITDFFGNQDVASGLAIQSDGKVVAAGYARHGTDSSTSDFALARYNQDGTLDQSFGTGGRQTTDFFGHSDQANDMAIQPDGKILLAGFTYQAVDPSTCNFALARYNQDGSLDQNFGSGGKQATDFFGNLDGADSVAIQPDGKIVAAGFAQHTSDYNTGDVAVARYSASTAAPDFSISFNPASVSTQAGSKLGVNLLISRTGGFTGNVTITPPAASQGIKAKPPDPVVTSASTAVFKMKIGGGVAPGSYSRTFTATDDSGKTRTASLTIVVQ
jgi:uncharacterized delta-60 repeat protein